MSGGERSAGVRNVRVSACGVNSDAWKAVMRDDDENSGDDGVCVRVWKCGACGAIHHAPRARL